MCVCVCVCGWMDDRWMNGWLKLELKHNFALWNKLILLLEHSNMEHVFRMYALIYHVSPVGRSRSELFEELDDSSE